MRWWIVLPALRISGGPIEALRLGEDICSRGGDVAVLSMWHSLQEVPTALAVQRLSTWIPRVSRAPLQLPMLMLRFRQWLASSANGSGDRFLFTHYSTLPLATLVPRTQRYFFVQGLEWKFIANAAASAVLRRWVLRSYRNGTTIAANAYLTAELRRAGIDVSLQMPVWADPAFGQVESTNRDIDYAMVLRSGSVKRLDLYLAFIDAAFAAGRRVVVISPEDAIVDQIREKVAVSLLRPSLQEMRAVYARSRLFVHLSDHEGFGLPPLEAMGAGCVPLCRDSGGVRAFMSEPELRELLLPVELNLAEIYSAGCSLLAEEERLQRLSRLSRKVYETGLTTTRLARAATLQHLQQLA